MERRKKAHPHGEVGKMPSSSKKKADSNSSDASAESEHDPDVEWKPSKQTEKQSAKLAKEAQEEKRLKAKKQNAPYALNKPIESYRAWIRKNRPEVWRECRKLEREKERKLKFKEVRNLVHEW